MSPRTLFALALVSLAAPAWSLSCDDVAALVAAGVPTAEILRQIDAAGGDTARLRQCLANLAAAPAPAAMPMEELTIDARTTRETARPTGKVAAPSPSRQRSDPVANTEGYTDYGVNELVLTHDDALSTFAVDVDTASYAISRRKLQEGVLPPEAAVRVEEFVNAMSYTYAPPRDGRPLAVAADGAPHPVVPNRHVLRVGLQGRERVGERPPVHLTFLVDTSGSMASEDKLGLAKRALHELVDNLGAEDTVALATYAGDTRRVLGPTYTSRKETIHAAIEQLSSGGGTAMSSGMETAYQMASESYLHGAENRVIVLSDGDANIGRVTHDEILATIRQYAERGITLTTVGFGMGNYQDTMMEQLANQGDGNYFYVDSFQEAQKVFGTDLSGTIETIARDVKVQVAFDPEAVSAWRLIGYENRDVADRDFRNDRVDAGEVGSGHRVTAVYDVVLRDGVTASDPLATVHVRAKAPGPDVAAKEWTTPVSVGALAADFDSASADLRRAWTVATFAEKLRGSPFAAEVSWAEIERQARGASRGIPADDELIGLLQTAARLSGEAVAARE